MRVVKRTISRRPRDHRKYIAPQVIAKHLRAIAVVLQRLPRTARMKGYLRLQTYTMTKVGE